MQDWLTMTATTMIVVFTASFIWMILYEKRKNSKHEQAKTEQRWQEVPVEPKTPYRPKGCLVSLIEAALYLAVILICLAVALMCLVLI